MYRKLPESSGNTLAYALEVELTREDVDKLQAELSTAMDQQGPLRVLVRTDGLEDIEPGAVWQDLKMTSDYVRNIERFAVVGDERWQEWLAKVSDTFIDAAYFPPEEFARAWAWIRDGVSSPRRR
jgi:hypothetical protein